MGARKKLISVCAAIVLLASLIWPAIYNRQPFLYPDTTSYMRTADPAVYKFTGIATWWTGRHDGGPDSSASQSATSPEATPSGTAQPPSQKVILVSRSIYYGFLLYLGFIASHFWLSVLLQAAAVLLAVYFALRMLGMPIWPVLFYLGFALCILSDAPFFASFLTPDLFAGIAILICAVLLACPRRVKPHEGAIAYLFLSACLLFHQSIILIVGGLAALALLLNTARRSWKNSGSLAILAAALVTGYLGTAFFHAMVRHATGQGTVGLPFLSARLVADGQGANYLRARCPANGFALCQFGPFSKDSDDFLWEGREKHGVFFVADPETQKKLSDQDFSFALAVLRYDPRGVLVAGVRNSAAQLVTFSLKDFNYPGDFDTSFPPSIVERLRSAAAYRGTVPVAIFSFLNYLIVCVAIAYLLARGSIAYRQKDTADRNLWIAIGWAIAGIVLNAVICGALSEPIPRYQARVIWLLPLAALLLELPARIKPWRRQNEIVEPQVLTARNVS